MFGTDLKRKEQEYRAAAVEKKQENILFYSQYLSELKEKNVEEVVLKGEGSMYMEFERKDYSFYKFSNISFGKERASSEDEFLCVEGVRFYYCDFSGCSFNNILFSNCLFIGCSFQECYSTGRGTAFEYCSFNKSVPGKDSIDDMPSVFNKCELSARFKNCDLNGVLSDKTNFYGTNFKTTNLYDTVFLDCGFDIARISGCDLRNARFISPKVNDFSIEDMETSTKANENTYFGRLHYDRKEKMEVKSAFQAYKAFSRMFGDNDIPELYGEYFYFAKCAEFKLLKGLAKVKSFLGFISCGYGERPFYSLIVSMLLVLICGTMYMFLGVNVNNEVIMYRPTAAIPFPALKELIVWYHFSLVTFTTTGYGNVVPVGGSVPVSGVEMVLGVIMVGTWVSTLVRKMTR